MKRNKHQSAIERIRFCLLDKNKAHLMRSVLGMDGMTLLPTLKESAHRVWPLLPLAMAGVTARYRLLRSLQKLRHAFSLSPHDWRMLSKHDPFYHDLLKQFPNASYSEIEALARRFRRGRQKGTTKTARKQHLKLALTDKQASVVSAFLGLDGKPPFHGTPYAFAHAQLSEHATSKQIGCLAAGIREHLMGVYRKIQHMWELSEIEYGVLIASNAWYAKFAEKFQGRMPETFEAIHNLLSIHKENGYQQKRESERSEVLSVYQTALWHRLSQSNQKLLTLFYNLDSASGKTRSSGQIARILGITKYNASVKITDAKYKLIALKPDLLIGVHAGSRNTRNTWGQYRRDVMMQPTLDDNAIQDHTIAMKQGELKSREILFHFGLRFLFPIAQKWSYSRGIRVWHQTGQSTLDLIQEANIGFYHALPGFIGNTIEQFRQFTEFAGDRSIRIALRYRGVPVMISREFTNKIRQTNKAWTRLFQELKHEPTPADIAIYLGMSTEEVEDTLAATNASVMATRSLDAPLTTEKEDDRTLHDLLPDISVNQPEAQLLEQEKELQLDRSLDALEHALAHKLSGIEQKVIMLRFGFQNDGEEDSLASIADAIGGSEEDVEQILNTALWKLRTDPQLQSAVQQLSS
ncbi:MAG: RNA polymerase primary sigma factor [Parcubacteria group bacterium Gr01-1014_70]|nr:MAG: RNA polymerase primary sigma factor [Parcubacteria group bacterium Gr01-1014_70]